MVAHASPAASARCSEAMLTVAQDPVAWAERTRSECAYLIQDKTCREAVQTPGSDVRSACMPKLEPTLAKRVTTALEAPPQEWAGRVTEVLTVLPEDKPEQ